MISPFLISILSSISLSLTVLFPSTRISLTSSFSDDKRTVPEARQTAAKQQKRIFVSKRFFLRTNFSSSHLAKQLPFFPIRQKQVRLKSGGNPALFQSQP